MRRLLPLLLLAAVPLMAQQDVLTIGSVPGAPGNVQVPIFLRDVAGTPLGSDRPAGSKLQAIAMRINFSPASAVTSASIARAGVLQNLTPLYENDIQVAGGGGIGWVVAFAEGNNTIPFTNSASGDLIGLMTVQVANGVAPQIALTIEPALATLSNQSGTVVETVANGSLALVNGIIAVTSDVRGDLTGDGYADLVWRNDAAGQTMLWSINGFSVTGQASLPAVSSSWSILAVDEFNGDLYSDLLWRNGSTNEIAVWLMNGASIASAAIAAQPPPAWAILGTGDFNGDGRSDILLRNANTSEAIVWFMNGTSVGSAATIAYPSSEWSVQAIADFNGDARADILWRHGPTNQVWLWLMNGASIASSAYVASPSSMWQAKGAADTSGDGRADVVWRNSSNNQVVVWRMSSATILEAAVLAAPLPAWDVRALADFNRDGRSDLMWRNTSTGENALWLLNGTAIQSSGYLPSIADQNWTVPGPR